MSEIISLSDPEQTKLSIVNKGVSDCVNEVCDCLAIIISVLIFIDTYIFIVL